jgi:hypothetical protein
VAAFFEVALRCPRFCQGKTSIDDHLKFFFLDGFEDVRLGEEGSDLGP